MIPSPARSAIDTALRSFLLSVLPAGIEVVLGQANRVGQPRGVDHVVFWPLRRARLRTNLDNYDLVDQTRTPEQAVDLVYQIDVHGPSSHDNAAVITTLWRDEYGVDSFAASLPDPSNPGLGLAAPLHADEPRQVPFIDAEQQYE
ncbi:MAG TPA: hypothetical protein VH916_04355, partial [Dehalococcoidia bacterium]